MADDAGRLNEVLAETSFLYGGNAGFVEDLHARWAANPNSVEPSWRAFFDSIRDKAGDWPNQQVSSQCEVKQTEKNLPEQTTG